MKRNREAQTECVEVIWVNGVIPTARKLSPNCLWKG